LAARVPLAADLVRDLLEAKDVALLYEVWSYFAVIESVASLIGKPASAATPRTDAMQITIPWDLTCDWPDGTRLIYNPRFSRTSKHRHSFSVPLRPDIALYVPGGPNSGLHLFDAKFKLDNLGDVMAAEDDDESSKVAEAEERRGTFTRGDLYKMHAYRDAIISARSVWILYPGTETRFFSEAEGVVDHPNSLPNTLEGVGAIPLIPGGDSRTALRAVLARLLFGESPNEAFA
jgi:predicted component of viral defense system (DUF524 family)